MAVWFRPKRYGLGFTPASWQGWAVTVAYVVVVSATGLTLAATQPWIFLTVFVLATVLFLLIALLTRSER